MPTPTTLPDAKSRLSQAAASYFVDPIHFMLAFDAAPVDATVALRDDPKVHGPTKTWLGTCRIAALHKDVITAARNVLRVTAPDKVRLTFRHPEDRP